MSRPSKFLARVLRHEPDLIDIQLDRQGWVQVDELLRKLKNVGHGMSTDQLRDIVETNDKKRFTISEDGKRIRAAQGHSIDVDLGLSAMPPPALLSYFSPV